LDIVLKIQELSKDKGSKLNNSKSAKILRKQIIKLLCKKSHSIMGVSRLLLVAYFRIYKNVMVLEKEGSVIRFGPNNEIRWKVKN